MEYKIFSYIRHKVKIPFFIRFILSAFLIFLSILPILLPLFPGSLFIGVIFLIIWILLIVPWWKIRYVIKIRKWIVYLFRNLHRKKIIDHKIKDFKEHIKEILKEDKENNNNL